MKLIIDIDKNIYHRFTNGFANENDAHLIEQLFKNGKPYEERPQGEWIISEYVDTRRGFITKCPFCKTDTIGGGNFCSYCGADMRGGVK